ncbi:MAG: [FeFe] hydrogenase H-cluster maturation GTPase HydF, partial [Spirochaetales bacterium]
EACTHAPQTEDIGRVKIPNILREKYGQRVHIQIVSGNDFPKDVSSYHLVIHCGGCMINKTLMMSRLEKLQKQNISVTNYGIFLAYATGILDKIDMPCE